MGIFNIITGRRNSGRTRVYGKNANRTFAPYQKRPDPNSNRSLGKTSRYKRF